MSARRKYAADEYEPGPMRVDDLPIFAQPVPYQRFSDTSKAAAESLESEVARIRQLVWLAYQKAGAEGLSADQAAEVTCPEGIDVKDWKFTCRPRVSELFTDGLLLKTDRRSTNDSGQTARILVAREYAQ